MVAAKTGVMLMLRRGHVFRGPVRWRRREMNAAAAVGKHMAVGGKKKYERRMQHSVRR